MYISWFSGTGKSASLLCAALAWQRYHAKMSWGKPVKDPSAGKAAVKESDVLETLLAGQGGENKFPRIIYCSRTHSQVEQMVAS
jgi:Rad3-related DNA helicase